MVVQDLNYLIEPSVWCCKFMIDSGKDSKVDFGICMIWQKIVSMFRMCFNFYRNSDLSIQGTGYVDDQNCKRFTRLQIHSILVSYQK